VSVTELEGALSVLRGKVGDAACQIMSVMIGRLNVAPPAVAMEDAPVVEVEETTPVAAE